MSLQNIGAANKDDAFYRYKMPKMITKIEGRGNGIKTNLVNMVDIAKALGRPASYTTKYFGCELGAQSKFDAKTGVSLVNGAHDTQKLAGLLENFIKKYVQCYECGNPETDVIITKSQMINLKCAACGFVSEVDMRDKLTTFILKNPPEPKKDSKDKKAMRRAEKERLQEGKAADEEQKKKKKEMKKGRSKVGDSAVEEQRKMKKGSVNARGVTALKTSSVKKKMSSSDEEHSSPPLSQAGDNVVEEDDDDDVQWQADTSVEAARQRIQEQLTSVTADMVMLSTNKRDPEEEKEARQINKEGVTNNGAKHSNEEDGRQNDLVMKIKDILREGCAPGQMVSSLGSLVGSPQEIMTALFEALFEGVTKGFAKEVAKKKSYLSAVATDETSQRLLLRAMEAFCSKSGAGVDAVKEVALVAKLLYDSDVLEEETILQWYEQGLAGCNKDAVIWKNVKPFVEWLQSAESESEE